MLVIPISSVYIFENMLRKFECINFFHTIFLNLWDPTFFKNKRRLLNCFKFYTFLHLHIFILLNKIPLPKKKSHKYVLSDLP